MRMRELILSVAIAVSPVADAAVAQTQAVPARPPAGKATAAAEPLPEPTIDPGQVQLLTLDGEFAQSVAKGGGPAFSSWFADDSVTLNNGKAAVLGHARIAGKATWKAQDYKLNWLPEGARMGPGGTMGFTWGHYTSESKDTEGRTVKKDGRYITIWKRMPDGKWKVALDASADDVADLSQVPTP